MQQMKQRSDEKDQRCQINNLHHSGERKLRKKFFSFCRGRRYPARTGRKNSGLLHIPLPDNQQFLLHWSKYHHDGKHILFVFTTQPQQSDTLPVMSNCHHYFRAWFFPSEDKFIPPWLHCKHVIFQCTYYRVLSSAIIYVFFANHIEVYLHMRTV